ncbi:hypothetical protein D3C81_1990800 [compost metagenome]
MRPTRSCCLTSWYLDFTSSRVVSLGAGKKSLMTLNTYGYDGSVNTSITSPRMPGATMNLSDECCR